MGSCQGCAKSPQALSYNIMTGQHFVADELGNYRVAHQLTKGLTHPYSRILASNNVFIGGEIGELGPIPKNKLFEDEPVEFVPAFIMRLEYDITTLDEDTLELVVPCKSLYYSAAKFEARGLATPSTHFCAKVCAVQVYSPSPDPNFAVDIEHVPSEAYGDCSDIPDPGWITYTGLTFTGTNNFTAVPYSLPFLKDFPGLEPALHDVFSITAGGTDFTYFGLCPQGVSSHSAVICTADSRGSVSVIIPSSICGPFCSSASASFSSKFNISLITRGYTAMPPGLAASNLFAEWMFGDYNPELDPDVISYVIPIGQSNRCGFRDPVGGRNYLLNDYVGTAVPEPVFTQSTIGSNYASYPSPPDFKKEMEALHFSQGNPADNANLGRSAIYTFVKPTGGVSTLTFGAFSLKRLPYRETTLNYDNTFKKDTRVVDYVMVIPENKLPSSWSVVSLVRLRGFESDYTLTFSEETLSLVAREEGDYVFGAAKYGYWEPAQITTNDQLKTGYINYKFDPINGDSVASFGIDIKRKDPALFGPPRIVGNYGYEPFILPGDAVPSDVTDCQDEYKHTHTVFEDNSLYEFRESSGNTGEDLAALLLGSNPVTFDLFTSLACNIDSPQVDANIATVTNVAAAVNDYLSINSSGATVNNLTGSSVLRIKPVPLG